MARGAAPRESLGALACLREGVSPRDAAEGALEEALPLDTTLVFEAGLDAGWGAADAEQAIRRITGTVENQRIGAP